MSHSRECRSRLFRSRFCRSSLCRSRSRWCTAFGYHSANEKCYNRRFSTPADYHIVLEWSLGEVISGKSQRIIEEAVFLTPPALHILFTVSSWVFAVEQFEIWHWKADEKTNLMKKIYKKTNIYSLRYPEICLTESKSWRKTDPLFSTFVFFSPYLREFLQ